MTLIQAIVIIITSYSTLSTACHNAGMEQPIHSTFDLEHWKETVGPPEEFTVHERRWAKEALEEYWDNDLMDYVRRAEPITEQELVEQMWARRVFSDTIWSPGSLASRIQVLDALPNDMKPPTFSETDVFVFGLGEPEHPAATKIGGLPYLPADQAWPRVDEQPMTFIAQLCFSDSADVIANSLPGDVLLIFLPHDYEETGILDDVLHFIWVPVTDAPLYHPDDVPDQVDPPTPCFGVRTRLIEFKSEDTMWRHQSTKIGGQPAWIQGHDDYLENGEQFIGALGCINDSAKHGPLINARNEDLTDEQRDGLWMFMDSGQLNVFIEADGQTTGSFECY